MQGFAGSKPIEDILFRTKVIAEYYTEAYKVVCFFSAVTIFFSE